jgi:hypothetical protein
MRALIGGLVVSLAVGCASPVPEKEPVVGPQGSAGLSGNQGPKGDVGPQGPAGADGKNGIDGVSAVAVISISDAGTCPNGGVKLLDQDGGSAVVCNGTNGSSGRDGATGATGSTGLTGAAGAQGVAGPQGPQGITPVTLTAYSADGGEIGPLLVTGPSNPLVYVYIKQTNCIGTIDWGTQKVDANQNSVLYTGPGCTGTSFVTLGQTAFFPTSCLRVGSLYFRSTNPVTVQYRQAQSTRVSFDLPDGGSQVSCEIVGDSGPSVQLEQFSMPSFSGPFSFGSR